MRRSVIPRPKTPLRRKAARANRRWTTRWMMDGYAMNTVRTLKSKQQSTMVGTRKIEWLAGSSVQEPRRTVGQQRLSPKAPLLLCPKAPAWYTGRISDNRVCVCSWHDAVFFLPVGIQHAYSTVAAHPVSVLIPRPEEMRALRSQNYDTEILHRKAVKEADGLTCAFIFVTASVWVSKVLQ